MKKINKIDTEKAFNELPCLPPAKEKIETLNYYALEVHRLEMSQ